MPFGVESTWDLPDDMQVLIGDLASPMPFGVESTWDCWGFN